MGDHGDQQDSRSHLTRLAEFRASHGESPDPLLFLPSQDQVELFLQKENLSLRLEKTEDGWKGSLFDNIKQDKRARFEFLFSPQEDPNEALSNPIAVHDIRCIHTKRFPFAEAQLADDFLAVTDSIEDAQELQDTLASIFHRLSQSSTYRRGGAWFAEVMIFVLALDQGYALEFSPAWTPPDHPQPDQVALLELDREKFILAARDNLLMRSVS